MKYCKLTILVTIWTMLIGSCAAYNIPYNQTGIGFSQEGSATIAIGSIDQRPYVLDGDKSPDFVGLIRGVLGNPLSMPTKSGAPLATEITQEISQSLIERGFKTKPVIVDPPTDSSQLMEKLKSGIYDRAISITINDWKTDSYASTSLYYDISLKVLDNSGNLRAETSAAGKDNIPSGSLDPLSWPRTQKLIPEAFKKKFESLLNHKDIVSALTSSQ